MNWAVGQKVVVEHCGQERVVEIDSGPFELVGLSGYYYDGWTQSDKLPEPYHVVFAAEAVKRLA
jgi:hypothetical protein